MSSMDPASGKRKEAKGKSKAAFDKLNIKEPIELSEHEEVIMGEVIGPEDIAVNFAGEPFEAVHLYDMTINKSIILTLHILLGLDLT